MLGSLRAKIKELFDNLFLRKKCKTCNGGCETSLEKCEKKCKQCMRQSKVAEVKRLAEEIDASHEGVKQYILCRLVPQMFYYGTQSLAHKNRFMRWTVVSLAVTGVIPVISMFTDKWQHINVGIAFLSSFGTFINAYLLTTNSKNTWILYRETRERLFNEFYKFYGDAAWFLKQEKSKLSSKIDDYESLCKKFIENCEMIMMKQMDDWLGLVLDEE